MNKLEYLQHINPAVLEQYYQLYLNNPDAVDYSWQRFFEGFEFARHTDFGAATNEFSNEEFKVIQLIQAYRQRGHLFTATNPVRTRRKYTPTLDIANFGLTENDKNKTFKAGELIGIGEASLNTIIQHLSETYCRSIGVEYWYIRQVEMVEWLRNKMESSKNSPVFSDEDKKFLFQTLARAVSFEKFLLKKFPGQKTFSLAGAENLIPSLQLLINNAVKFGIKEFVVGMAHRGRLNVLANIFQKDTRQIFSEFAGLEYDDVHLLGDVKYHLGYTTTFNAASAEAVRISLCPNPSHLEAVTPVVPGIARALLDNEYDNNLKSVVPVVIHGDAAIAGQGVVYEVLQMSQLEAFHVGGTIHIVINNQLGFTTNYLDARSSIYCTDVAKTIQSPIFHVNGDDAEAVAYVVLLAMEFRQRYHRDVFIDLLCYRKFGHNESDEPRFTQPLLYKIIEKHPNPAEIYEKQLIIQNLLPENSLKAIEEQYNNELDRNLQKAKCITKVKISSFMEHRWVHIRKATDQDFQHAVNTAIPAERVSFLFEMINSKPENKRLFKKLEKIIEERARLFKEDTLDWAIGELLAYASLLYEGYHVRICGQDSERGTFSHRHAVLKLEDSEQEFVPMHQVAEKYHTKFNIYNSLLSEYAVLGYEYGYSLTNPNTLTVWEAQFGDFFNGAQIIIDQYITTAEEKWNVMNGLTLYLPHGFEGMGPEHSSARIERFLTLCADLNMVVVNCSTPANLFHILRQQMLATFRKPLVMFTPKSLLRHPLCRSSVNDFTASNFKHIIEPQVINTNKIGKIIVCSGKVYYDLMQYQTDNNRSDVAIFRLEQIYPFPMRQFEQIKAKYQHVNSWLWVQEEPANMGVWPFIYQQCIEGMHWKVIARPVSGSPATGSFKVHKLQQDSILKAAFNE